MNNTLLTVKNANLLHRIQSLLEESFFDGHDPVELNNFRKLFDWKEKFFIVYISYDGKDGVIEYNDIFEMKETYADNYRPSISEVEWCEEPNNHGSGLAEPCNIVFDVCDIVLKEQK